MKKMKDLLMVLLVTVMSFLTACNREDSVTDASANEERGVVKTEFTISFPQTTTGLTRLSSNVVQVPGAGNVVNFRGIDNILLYPFKSAPEEIDENTAVPQLPITLYGGATTEPAGASGTQNNTIAGGSTALYEGSKAHLYKNVDIAIGTKAFIFYGEAAGGAGQQAYDVGNLTRNISATDSKLSGITFSPVQIYTDATAHSDGQKLANYLTHIANTTGWSTTENVGLSALYSNFVNIHLASSAAVQEIAQRVYDQLAANTADLQATKDLKTAIRNSITAATYGVSAGTDGKLTFSNDFPQDYPASIKLPDGAAYVKWESGAFQPVVSEDQNIGLNNVAEMSKFVYPSSLYYWVKSGIKTSETPKESYSPSDTWSTITNAYTNGAEVTSKTRSIVIEDAVQYAVARLDLTVKASAVTIKDSDPTISGGKNINLTDGGTPSKNLFPVTGVIIGGQKEVDYKFEQKSGATPHIVYDSQVNDGGTRYLTTTASSAIHTLVLETNDATGAEDTNADVQIAVEFKNEGSQTIVGYNGEYIFPGCKFYLIGTLHPWKEGESIRRAFKQDYTTFANLTINSFKNARSTLPDLSIPQLSLGVSIDLTWRNGVTYDISIN